MSDTASQPAASRPTRGAPRYDAFISYRHCEPDRRWAKWLHRALETYRPPRDLVRRGVPARIGRVFRDEDELPASADLNRAIDEALEASRFLIVVCSTHTPESRWVNQEIVRFRELGRGDRILALLVEGEPGDAFPVALREIRTRISGGQGMRTEEIEEVEPLAADVRASRTERPSELKRMARLRLAACILGCRFDDLRRREQERHRRRLFAASAVLAGLVVLFGVLSFWALRERAATVEALGRARHAGLLSASRSVQSENPTLALLLARAAAAAQSTPKAATRLHEALAASPARRVLGDGKHYAGAILDPHGRLALTGAGRDAAILWDLADGASIRLELPGARLDPGAISSDGRHVVTTGDAVRLWAVEDGAASLVWSRPVEQRLAVLSPDGEHLVTAGFGAPVVWTRAGRQVAVLAGGVPPPATVETVDVAWAPGGDAVATAHSDGIVRLWSPAGGVQASFRHPFVRAVAFTADGVSVLTLGMGSVAVWDRAGEELQSLVLAGVEDAIRYGAFSPAGDALLATFDDGRACLWRIAGSPAQVAATPTVFRVANAKLRDLLLTPDGRRVVASATDGTVRIWDRRGAARAVLGGLPELHFRDGLVGFAEQGRQVVLLAGGLHVWSLAGEEVAVLDAPQDWDGQDGKVWKASFTSDGRGLLTHSRTVSTGETVGRWSLSGELLAEVNDQRVLATGSDRFLVRAGEVLRLVGWDGTTIATLATKGRPPIVGAALSPAGDRVVAISHDGTLELWDGSGDLLYTATTYTRHGVSLAFAPDGRHFAVGAGSTEFGALTLWTRDGEEVEMEGSGHDAYVTDIVFSPDGTRLLTASMDETVVLHEVGGELGQRFVGHEGIANSVAFSPDGRFVLTAASDGSARLWNLAGQVLAVLSGHTAEVRAAVFSAHGDLILTASADGTARLWNFAGRELAVLRGHRGGLLDASFSPDGRYAVTAGEDGTARVFLVHVEDLLELARVRSVRTFTSRERARFTELLGD